MLNMRSDRVMMDLILGVAQDDERIRAVIMNGSRTSPGASKDHFQDFDIVYVVNDVEPFVDDVNWISRFGDLIILQKPDLMDGVWPASKGKFIFLMLFTDGNRIDLTLLAKNNINTMHRDSQSILLLDKDNCISPFPEASDDDYLPVVPTEVEFQNCCNEFFWVLTSVAKGIYREQLTYTKSFIENIAKEELIKLLCWHTAIKTEFKQSVGKFGKYLEKMLEPDVWLSFKKTYVDAEYKNIWLGVFEMCELFNKIALGVSGHFGFVYDENEYRNVVAYLKAARQTPTHPAANS